MRKIIILCMIVFSNISGFSQNFHITDNLIMEKIAEIEFRNAYQSKYKSVFKWKYKGREHHRVVRDFLDSEMAKKNNVFDELSETKNFSIRCLKLNSKCPDKSYVLQETKDVLSKAYYMKGETPDNTVMFGVGDVDNDQIYYATPDYDCDQHLWCRWYSFSDGKVSILAEIEDKSFEYDLADYDLPSFFADNRGFYYLVVNKNPNIYNNVGEKMFYRIRLV